MGSFAIAAMAMKVAFAVLALVVCAYAIPEEDIHSALSDLTSLVQEQKSAPEVAEYSVEQFATLMNRIVGQAGKMRVVMNKLGISDTDSVEKEEKIVEQPKGVKEGLKSKPLWRTARVRQLRAVSKMSASPRRQRPRRRSKTIVRIETKSAVLKPRTHACALKHQHA